MQDLLAWPATDFWPEVKGKKGEILKNTQATTEILYFLEVVTSVILYKSPKAQRNYGTDQRGALTYARLG